MTVANWQTPVRGTKAAALSGRGGSGVHVRQSVIESLTFEHLRSFHVIAMAGSFQHAGELLYVSQSAISQRVRRIEKLLGVRLFDRDRGTAICLTEAGEMLLDFADAILPVLEEMDKSIQRMSLPRETEEVVSVAAGNSLLQYVLLEVVPAFNETSPDISIRLEATASAREVLDLVLDSEVDLGLYPGRYGGGSEFRTLKVLREKIFLVAHPASPLFEIPPSEVQARLMMENYAVLTQGVVRELTDRWAHDQGVDLHVTLEGHTASAIMVAARGGTAVAIAPSFAIGNDLAAGTVRLVDAPGFPLDLPVSVIASKQTPLSLAARSFAAALCGSPGAAA